MNTNLGYSDTIEIVRDFVGIQYSGTKCDTDYNMYTYRDIERKAVQIFQAA